ncbi:MAG: hypothetical protein SCL54_04030 [Bacillota bacterium]|nr:hypothetical protein [Bacillota bacterium]
MDRLDDKLKIQAPKFISEYDLLILAKNKLRENNRDLLITQMDLLFNSKTSGYKYCAIMAFVDVEYI